MIEVSRQIRRHVLSHTDIAAENLPQRNFLLKGEWFNPNARAGWQLRPRRQHHFAVFDYADHAHTIFKLPWLGCVDNPQLITVITGP